MTVVMALIAILFTIGAFGMLSARDQYLLDSEAEKLLSTIREAQNKAIAVNKDRDGNETKVWSLGLYPNSNSYALESFYPSGAVPGSLNLLSERSASLPAGFTITAQNSAIGNTDPHISFTSPFATPFITSSSRAGSGACTWKTDATRAAKDYFIDSSCNTVMASQKTSNSNILTITLRYKTLLERIRVNTNGDAYIE